MSKDRREPERPAAGPEAARGAARRSLDRDELAARLFVQHFRRPAQVTPAGLAVECIQAANAFFAVLQGDLPAPARENISQEIASSEPDRPAPAD